MKPVSIINRINRGLGIFHYCRKAVSTLPLQYLKGNVKVEQKFWKFHYLNSYVSLKVIGLSVQVFPPRAGFSACPSARSIR